MYLPTSTSMPAKLSARHRGAFEWIKCFASYSAVQAIAQAVGFISGILIVRNLSQAEYACFVIVNTIVPALTLLSDNGVTGSLSAIGGKFWRDDRKMNVLVTTAMGLRTKLILISAACIIPFLVWMLLRNHASTMTTVALSFLTLIGAYFQLNIGVLSVFMNLRQQISKMQGAVLMSAVPRLAILVIFAAVGFLNAPLAIAAGTAALLGQFIMVRRWVAPHLCERVEPSSEYQKEILAIVKRQAPLTIFFCIQGQLTIWLISVFGSARHVAEVGALGRIGAIFTILASTTSAIIVPRFSREQNPDKLRSRYALILSTFATLVACASIAGWLVPGPVLWLLGKQYDHLGGWVWLANLSAGSSSLTGVLFSLNVNKGWIPPAALMIPAEILGQIILCCIFDLSSARGVFSIGVLGPVVPAIINIIVALRMISRQRATMEAKLS